MPDANTAATRRPIITLTTDFGLTDFYVGVMKAVLLTHCPDAQVVDITHGVPRHDVIAGAIALERAVAAFPQGTVHLAVVDPGVGTARRLIIAKLREQYVICPDNGLITWAWRRHEPGQCRELTWRPAQASNTFHGRDIMGPVAARLARGEDVTLLGKLINDPALLDIAPATLPSQSARVIYIDIYGNVTTNVPADVIERHPVKNIIVGNMSLGAIRRTYGDVATGQALALIGSSDLLEIAVREGSAAEKFGLNVGDEIQLR